MTATPAAWEVLQVAELIRSADVLLLQGLSTLQAVTPNIQDGYEVPLDADDVEQLHAVAEHLAEVVDQMRVLVERLPTEGIEVAHDAIAERADADLAGGIIDPARALLAARVLPAVAGWRSLAHALRTADTHLAWETTTVEEVLAAFRGRSDAAVAHIMACAQIEPGARFASCDEPTTARLAAALEDHVGPVR